MVKLSAAFRIYAIGEGQDRVLLGLHVDDMFMLGELLHRLAELQNFLCSRFRMKHLGQVKFLQGMEIRKQADGDILLLQEKYTSDVLQKFNMSDCRSATTPLPLASKLSSSDSPTTEEEKQAMDLLPYKSAIGSLMYLAVCTRPDIA